MLAPETVLQNRYRVERQIGEGGMGAVYVATDQRFGSTVALKETFFEDPGLRKAFEREARLLNHLRHPALPRVSDHFTEGPGQFLVMEYIEGSDLSELLKQRGAGFPAAQVLAWADQLLDALEYLHAQQPPVIHRDIKPQNLKLGARNQVVLLDFGLAKGAPLQTRVTAPGSVFGYSFNYAPIEQMQGTGTDPRSDLYSLGATLYHLLTGATPPDALTRATAVLSGDPDPLRPASDVNADVPAEVGEVLARAMSQSAARRFASAEEMRAALREAGRKVTSDVEASARAPAPRQADTAQGRASPSEKETYLMYPPATNRLPLAEAEEMLEETAVSSRPEAATLADTQAATAQGREGEKAKAFKGEGTGVIKGGTATAFEGERTSALDGVRASAPARAGDKSVVTNVAAARGAGATRNGSRRAVVAALCAVAVALAAVVLYALARRAPSVDADSHGPVVAQPTPQPSQQPEPQPTPAPAEGEKAAQAPDANDSAHGVAQPRQTPNAADRNAKPREEGQNRPAQNTPPQPPTVTPPERAGQVEEEEPFRDRDWSRNPPTDEEIQRWMAEHPGWLERNPSRARMFRRRLMQGQRRGRNNRPPRQPQP